MGGTVLKPVFSESRDTAVVSFLPHFARDTMFTWVTCPCNPVQGWSWRPEGALASQRQWTRKQQKEKQVLSQPGRGSRQEGPRDTRLPAELREAEEASCDGQFGQIPVPGGGYCVS